MTERRVLFACDLDSQVFGALPLALAFAARGWKVTFAIESSRTLPQPVLERLAGSYGVLERPIGALPTDDEAFRHDAIGVYVTGSRLALFRHLLELSSRVKGLPRPALFCGFNGLVFEKFEEGLAWRLGYDVIGLNGPRDRDAFVDFLHATEFARQPSVIVGLRRKTDTPPRPLKLPPPPPSAPEDRPVPGAFTAAADPTFAATPADGPILDPEALQTAVAPAETVARPDAAAPADAAPANGEASPDLEAAEKPETAEFAEAEDDDGGVEDATGDADLDDQDAVEADDSEADEGDEAPPSGDAPETNGNGEADQAPVNGDAAEAGSNGAVPAVPSAPHKLFVFAEQVVVPRSLRERQSLVATLARLAKASPGWDIALKARVRPNEQTFHAQPNHVEKLVKGLRSRPRNLRVTYEPLEQLLERADLFATISSTALFDAFDYGVPSLVASDFGLRNADGAHVFFASGLLVRLCDLPSLDAAPMKAPEERWIRRMGYGSPYSPNALIDWLETFDPNLPMAKPFVPFTAAVSVASNSSVTAGNVTAAWKKVASAELDESLNEEERRAAMQAGLLKLGSLVTSALSPAPAAAKRSPAPAAGTTASKPALVKLEGPVAAMSRKVGMYWAYKRARQRLGLPIHAPRQ